MTPVGIRLLTVQDVAAVLRLVDLAGWNQTAADVSRLVDLEPAGCFAAWADGRVIGTTTTTTYGPDLAWVGMVLVDPAHRRRGVATALVETALASLRDRGVRTVKLDATAAGQPVYERFGFRAEAVLERWAGILPAGTAAEPEFGTWEEVAVADLAAFGADRGPLVRRLMADGGTGLPVVRGPGGEPAGYALSRPGARAGYVGPVVADGPDTARALIVSAAASHTGRPVFVDIDPAFPGATDVVAGLGFARQRELVRMRLGPGVSVGGPLRVFAIAGPAVG